MSQTSTADKRKADVPARPAEIVREYGPFAGSSNSVANTLVAPPQLTISKSQSVAPAPVRTP